MEEIEREKAAKKGKKVEIDPVFKHPIYLQVKIGEMEPSSYLKDPKIRNKQLDSNQVMKFLIIPESTMVDFHYEKVIDYVDAANTITRNTEKILDCADLRDKDGKKIPYPKTLVLSINQFKVNNFYINEKTLKV